MTVDGVVSPAVAWPGRWARPLLVALHLAAIALPTVFTVSGSFAPVRGSGAALLVALAIAAVQLRHSLAAARGTRPRGWPWTLLLLAALVYGPMPWFHAANWGIAQVVLIASALMLLPGWSRLLVVPPYVGVEVVASLQASSNPAALAYTIIVLVIGCAAIGVALYAAARLVYVLDELQTTRTELAELAIGRERLRVSRDLHDLLGQSLSAISLKGDLAIRLLHNDVPAARAEIESLTGVARTALRGVRTITRDAHTMSLPDEAKGAAALLTAAGVRADVSLDLPRLSPAVERTLAWALREGVTNVLRHSQARTCTITAARHHGTLRLEIVNDRAGPPSGIGNGLAGLAERARELAASVSAEPTPDGGFRLRIDIPQAAT